MVGLFDFSEYETGETTVSPGDLLVVFSDGVTEAVNASGDEFEDERLAAMPHDRARQVGGRSARGDSDVGRRIHGRGTGPRRYDGHGDSLPVSTARLGPWRRRFVLAHEPLDRRYSR